MQNTTKTISDQLLYEITKKYANKAVSDGVASSVDEVIFSLIEVPAFLSRIEDLTKLYAELVQNVINNDQSVDEFDTWFLQVA